MRPLMLSQIALWCEGRLLGDDVEITGIGTDTRTLARGGLFVALRGERVDGHDLAEAATAAGAAALLVTRPVDTDLPQVQCADTQEALGEIAANLQHGRPAVVVALTGSNGKTTVKTLLHGILRRAGRTTVNPGNRNNEIGLPLAVIDAPEDAQFAIYEMGAGKHGDIAYLTAIAPPQVALVNNIMPAHVERMGNLLGIAETKGAIYEALPDDGVAVVNADDAFAPYFLQRIATRRVLRFGIEHPADVRASQIRSEGEGMRFVLHCPAGQAEVALPLPGRHNVMNALAAAALALGAGAGFDDIVAGLNAAEPVPGRQIPHRLQSGALLIDDSYNANPGSVAAAIASLGEALRTQGGQAWLVLGDMKELGRDERILHSQIGALAKTSGIARLFVLGALSVETAKAFGDAAKHYSDHDALLAELLPALAEAGDDLRCLVKGSRSSAMERIVAAVLAAQAMEEGGDAA
ncbi:MAG TPA: UDP-N-acetylmuramoyl-tripeptide--D-alanyl-D-alanine ligase [Arenimonas sp.]|nr:UDP-N-acetylmuramoyl-tripeptide--D-alanyl-D-alanine ligase [Arenimonas sp.]